MSVLALLMHELLLVVFDELVEIVVGKYIHLDSLCEASFFEQGGVFLGVLHITILIIQHISCCYEEQKITCMRFFSLFSLGMGQEKDLTASMHGRMLSPT